MMINVVGSGLAGSIVTRYLRNAGHEVRVIDDDDQHSGSKASSNLYIGSWLKKFGSAVAAEAIAALKALDLPEDQPFDTGLADAIKVRHIAQRHILVEPDEVGTVVAVHDDGTVQFSSGESLAANAAVLCCGHRGAELCPSYQSRLEVKVGHCYFFMGDLHAGDSNLRLVSPYTHGKLYQYEPGLIYYADSVALKPESFWKRQEELKERTLVRARKALGVADAEPVGYRVGMRPLLAGDPFGALTQVGLRVWAVNGGGKNGMVAYALRARDLTRQLEEIS